MSLKNLSFAAVVIASLLPVSALATNGYFSHGFGVRAQAVAGTAFALPQDALAAASNPAGTAWVNSRVDAGMTYFRPQRESRISGSANPAVNGRYDANRDSAFWIPELGVVQALSEQLAWGVAIYGNGGMNTRYKDNPFAAFGGQGDAGVDMRQAFFTPSIAFRPLPQHSFGVALTFAYQEFAARGIQGFAGFSNNGTAVSNNSHDSATGWGIKLGWLGQLHERVRLGISWSSRIRMDAFDDYAGLFAGYGDFDVPENYGIGISVLAADSLTVAADWQRIEYSEIASVGNPVNSLFAGQPLGTANGPGFGWQDIDVIKLGLVYQPHAAWTLRAGISHADQPIPRDQTFFNILAPGVIEDHASIGFSWNSGRNGEWSVSYTHAFEETVEGKNSIPVAFGGGEADLTMSQDIFAVSWSKGL